MTPDEGKWSPEYRRGDDEETHQPRQGAARQSTSIGLAVWPDFGGLDDSCFCGAGARDLSECELRGELLPVHRNHQASEPDSQCLCGGKELSGRLFGLRKPGPKRDELWLQLVRHRDGPRVVRGKPRQRFGEPE